jgi:hypothetical protein
VAQHRGRLQHEQDEVQRCRAELEQQQAELKSQRQHVADQLRRQRQKQQRELAAERAELDRRKSAVGEAEALAKQLTEAQKRAKQLEADRATWQKNPTASESANGQVAALAEMQQRYEAAIHELSQQRSQVQQQQAEVELRRLELEQSQADVRRQRKKIADELKRKRDENLRKLADERADLDRLRQELGETEVLGRRLDESRQRLVLLEEKLAAAGTSTPASESNRDQSQALADMTRRYELAMEDLRDQKRKIAELEKQPAAPRPVADSGQKLDWEAQKRKILAALEADSDDDEQGHEEKLKIQEVIHRTDAIIAEKDQEIQQLRDALSAQSSAGGGVSPDAIAEMVSADEQVRSERERLQQLQQEWEEKLRQAEIDLSVQRAKIARERAEIEERQRALQEQGSAPGSARSGQGTQGDKPQRGRWLARLGLKDEEK